MSTLFLVPLADEADRERLLDLYTFAQQGEVVVEYRELDPEDHGYDRDADSYDDNMVRVTDRADRSDDPWFPLAQALSWASASVLGHDQPAGLGFTSHGNNSEFVQAAAQQSGLSVVELAR